MKYVISFHGIDVEILMSEVPEKMLKHFKDSDLDVGDYMCGESENYLLISLAELALIIKMNVTDFTITAGLF